MVRSNTSQARVFIDSVDAGITPCVVKVREKGPEPVVRLEKNGYTAKEVMLKKKFNVVYTIEISLLSGAFFASRLLSSSLIDGKVTKPAFIGASVGTVVILGGGLICGLFTGDYYKFKPRKVNLSLDKFNNKINAIIQNVLLSWLSIGDFFII